MGKFERLVLDLIGLLLISLILGAVIYTAVEMFQ